MLIKFAQFGLTGKDIGRIQDLGEIFSSNN